MFKGPISSILGSRNPSNLGKDANAQQVVKDHQATQQGWSGISLALFSPLWLPVWALYHIGEGNWSRYGRIQKAASVIFLVLWGVAAVLILAAPLIRNANPAFFDSLDFYAGLLPVAALALVASYLVGRFIMRNRPNKDEDEAQAPTWK